MPLLKGIMDEPQNPNRGVAAYAIGYIPDIGTNGKSTVTTLINGANGNDPLLTLSCVGALGNLRAEPDIVVPFLADKLKVFCSIVQLTAVEALGRFGVDAKPALAGVTRMLSAADPSVRAMTTNALKRIAPEVSEPGGRMVEAWRSSR